MSQTFGERITAIEERLDNLAEIMEAILQGFGFIDSEGNWVESDEPAAEPRD